MIGEPDAGKLHVRFDEGMQETCDYATRLYVGGDGQAHEVQGTAFKIVRAFLDRTQLHSDQGAAFEYDVQFAPAASQNLCVTMHVAGPVVLVQSPPPVIPMDANGLGRFGGKIRATQVTPGAVVPFDLTPNIHVCGQ